MDALSDVLRVVGLCGGVFMDAVTNVGTRPTFGESGLTIETFVLSGTVPEEVAKARLDFIYRLRDERKFDSPEQLRSQIALDVGRAQKFFRMMGREKRGGNHTN